MERGMMTAQLRFGVLCLLVLTLSGLSLRAAPPPLIDRNLFFSEPEISGAQISPAGRFLAFFKPVRGTRNIWVKQTDEPFGNARPLTAAIENSPQNFYWTRDSKYILFTQDVGGNAKENIHEGVFV